MTYDNAIWIVAALLIICVLTFYEGIKSKDENQIFPLIKIWIAVICGVILTLALKK